MPREEPKETQKQVYFNTCDLESQTESEELKMAKTNTVKETEKKELRNFDVILKIEDSTVKLELLPSILQNLVDFLKLDQRILTEEDKMNIWLHADSISKYISLTQTIILDHLSDLNDLVEMLKEK